MPIRGHSNVQGIGSVGVTPQLKKAMLERFEQRLGVAAADVSPGLDTMACMDAADRGEMDVALCLGGNLYGSNPDAAFAEQAIREARTRRPISPRRSTPGHAWGRGQRDADPAGAAARRRAAADDAGIDVQLRATERRRAARVSGAAQRGLGADRRSAGGPGRPTGPSTGRNWKATSAVRAVDRRD